jgi:hypothetical protein
MSASMITQTLLDALPDALSSLIRAQLRIGTDLLSLAGGTRIFEGTKTSVEQLLTRRPSGCCDIPAPCWMPKPLGQVVSLAAECGGTATLCFHVKNCGLMAQPITVQTRTADPSHQIAGATFVVTPPALTLGPLEENDIKVTLKIPDGVKDGQADVNVFVQGCQTHYLRWTVKVGSILKSSTHEVSVCDCPDLVHHWYDHFYCGGRCQHQLGKA